LQETGKVELSTNVDPASLPKYSPTNPKATGKIELNADGTPKQNGTGSKPAQTAVTGTIGLPDPEPRVTPSGIPKTPDLPKNTTTAVTGEVSLTPNIESRPTLTLPEAPKSTSPQNTGAVNLTQQPSGPSEVLPKTGSAAVSMPTGQVALPNGGSGDGSKPSGQTAPKNTGAVSLTPQATSPSVAGPLQPSAPAVSTSTGEVSLSSIPKTTSANTATAQPAPTAPKNTGAVSLPQIKAADPTPYQAPVQSGDTSPKNTGAVSLTPQPKPLAPTSAAPNAPAVSTPTGQIALKNNPTSNSGISATETAPKNTGAVSLAPQPKPTFPTAPVPEAKTPAVSTPTGQIALPAPKLGAGTTPTSSGAKTQVTTGDVKLAPVPKSEVKPEAVEPPPAPKDTNPKATGVVKLKPGETPKPQAAGKKEPIGEIEFEPWKGE